ncbi:MAG: glycosyltransferase family 9 protein [Bacteroidetes bacterium]|nr:glycosyltransferase family 9 protein [Bacteroidota bacterium]MBU1423187.1 glycosyltransferase family 9 protein [Bacteroidota bacterium]
MALSGIGDALMFSPAISVLRKNLPDAEIDLLCMIKGVKEIYELNPKVNKVIHFNFLKEGFLKSLFFALKLRRKYDVTFNVYPANRKEYNIIAFLIGAKKRFAVRYLRSDNSNLGFLNNQAIIENDSLHNVQENLALVKKFLNLPTIKEERMEIFLNPSHDQFAENFLLTTLNSKLKTKNHKQKTTNHQLLIGFHAGCATLKNHIKRRWEPEKFARLGLLLKEKFNAEILLFGGPDEYELNSHINSLMNHSAIEVKTNTLIETASVMKRCDLFITNDSALMHIASALGLKVVALFGPTNTNYVHPWKTEHVIVKTNLDCQPCFYYSPKPLTCTRTDLQFKCIKDLSVEVVLDYVEGLIF